MTDTFTMPQDPAAVAPVDYTAEPSTAPAEPQLIAGKFKTQDDLVAAYKALESKLGKPAEPAPTTSQSPATPATQEPATDPLTIPPAFNPAEPVYTPGLSSQQVMDFANQEYAANQKLSDNAYAALASQGVSKEMVDAYIAGQQATQQAQLAETFAVVGGKEQFQTMTAWASNNLSDAEIDEFNAAVAKPETRKLAMLALQGKYVAANGAAPTTLVTGGSSPAANAFASKAEMVAAMQDPRYAKDPAYRDAVAKKLANSFL